MNNKTMVSFLAFFLIMAINSIANVAEPEKHIVPAQAIPPSSVMFHANFIHDYTNVIVLAGNPAKKTATVVKKAVGDAVKKGKKVVKKVGQTVKGIGRKKNNKSEEPEKGSGTGHNPNNRMYEGQEDTGTRSDSYTKGGGGYHTMQQ